MFFNDNSKKYCLFQSLEKCLYVLRSLKIYSIFKMEFVECQMQWQIYSKNQSQSYEPFLHSTNAFEIPQNLSIMVKKNSIMTHTSFKKDITNVWDTISLDENYIFISLSDIIPWANHEQT